MKFPIKYVFFWTNSWFSIFDFVFSFIGQIFWVETSRTFYFEHSFMSKTHFCDYYKLLMIYYVIEFDLIMIYYFITAEATLIKKCDKWTNTGHTSHVFNIYWYVAKDMFCIYAIYVKRCWVQCFCIFSGFWLLGNMNLL